MLVRLEQPFVSSDGFVSTRAGGETRDHSLMELLLRLAEVRYELRGRSGPVLPTEALALAEGELVAELRQRGVPSMPHAR